MKKDQTRALFTKASKTQISHGCPSPTKELSQTARIIRDILQRKNNCS